ncbi:MULTISPECIES: phosphoribosylamine--glycine ligase [Helcococcus]|uniref:Phosphoribosylamine--glycine ligase n=1 Tax=Helcococcus bovis TaxID=3153252 RepID=A0ABW9F4I4_9FIRM
MSRVLVLGNGGREHAISYKLFNEGHDIFMLGQNPGVAKFGTCVEISEDQIAEFCKNNIIDLVFVGPEKYLVDGIVDKLENEQIRVFGPNKRAAILEGSKSFSKNLMKKYYIPTAKFEIFEKIEEAKEYLKNLDFPIVIKADGIASGKGVIIAESYESSISDLEEIMINNKFNDAGKKVVIEEFLVGEEFSLMCFVSGNKVYPMKIAQDHKRAFDNDEGLNTGGMGAYLPIKHITEEDVKEAVDKIIIPTVEAMISENREFKGILFAGLMKTADGIKTIEYNVRFGDPESEIILQSMNSSLFDIANDIIDGNDINLEWDDKSHVGVVLASKGYPEIYENGYEILGLEKIESQIFYMGTKELNGKIVTNGGRVLIVCASAHTLEEAIEKAYKDIEKIECDNLYYRNDIGHLSLK